MRITLPNVWPFMKLPNGFGSHRYVYSPILFDSQDLNHNLSTQPSATAGDASPVTTIVPRVVDRQCNGNADGYHLKFLAAAGAAPEDNYGDRVSAMDNGNAYDQLPSQLLVPAAGPAPGTMPLGWRFSAMGNGECSPGSQPTLRGTLGWTSVY